VRSTEIWPSDDDQCFVLLYDVSASRIVESSLARTIHWVVWSRSAADASEEVVYFSSSQGCLLPVDSYCSVRNSSQQIHYYYICIQNSDIFLLILSSFVQREEETTLSASMNLASHTTSKEFKLVALDSYSEALLPCYYIPTLEGMSSEVGPNLEHRAKNTRKNQ